MASSINSRMAAIGKTYLRDLPPYKGDILALQAVANTGSNRRADESITLPSTRTGQKKGKWTTLMLVDSQAVKNTCNASIESLMILFLQIYKWY